MEIGREERIVDPRNNWVPQPQSHTVCNRCSEFIQHTNTFFPYLFMGQAWLLRDTGCSEMRYLPSASQTYWKRCCLFPSFHGELFPSEVDVITPFSSVNQCWLSSCGRVRTYLFPMGSKYSRRLTILKAGILIYFSSFCTIQGIVPIEWIP